jgi:hypothetical protein
MIDDAINKLEKANRVYGRPFQPGAPGRPPGTQNKLQKTVKETVLSVFNEIQADPKANLTAFAKKYPRDFYAIAARLIPTEITGTLRQVIRVTDTEPTDEIEEAEVIPPDVTDTHERS